MNEYTAEMAHAAVARGAAWLDEKCPEWVREINLDRLDLGSITFCVLGQTAKCLLGKKPDGHAMRNGFREVECAQLGQGWDYTTPGQLGFNIPSNIDVPTGGFEAIHEMHTIAWKELIRQRLEVQP